jgi:hypothetical protein
MLRITAAETATEQRWTLEGRLVGPWVGELSTRWKKRHRAQNGRTCTVGLGAVTFIDKGGQRLSRIMSKEATQFMATSIYIKHVLDPWTPIGKRGLLKVIYCFFAALLGESSLPCRVCKRAGNGPFLLLALGTPPLSLGPRRIL